MAAAAGRYSIPGLPFCHLSAGMILPSVSLCFISWTGLGYLRTPDSGRKYISPPAGQLLSAVSKMPSQPPGAGLRESEVHDDIASWKPSASTLSNKLVTANQILKQRPLPTALSPMRTETLAILFSAVSLGSTTGLLPSRPSYWKNCWFEHFWAPTLCHTCKHPMNLYVRVAALGYFLGSPFTGCGNFDKLLDISRLHFLNGKGGRIIILTHIGGWVNAMKSDSAQSRAHSKSWV